ncbi:MAG: hypothetical protein M3O22_05305 [Pseudomonadota bacterium]|nr:hypothetical protein [Pseudomonadota bacterium]
MEQDFSGYPHVAEFDRALRSFEALGAFVRGKTERELRGFFSDFPAEVMTWSVLVKPPEDQRQSFLKRTAVVLKALGQEDAWEDFMGTFDLLAPERQVLENRARVLRADPHFRSLVPVDGVSGLFQATELLLQVREIIDQATAGRENFDLTAGTVSGLVRHLVAEGKAMDAATVVIVLANTSAGDILQGLDRETVVELMESLGGRPDTASRMLSLASALKRAGLDHLVVMAKAPGP